ncbi:DUF6428 family protein [Moraxella nasovis]|uniref:DUF6428 family protein n=1 Tax=Moraxella nasovis TaxID=2904121 RepID=UPI001F624283|nr:DUF6428 family protein [Moraxella nasovis]UNU73830.1 DUF6428 family protein [Moraxella nasovis]
MKLSQIKDILGSVDNISFILEDGTTVPPHFHVTEVGLISQHFIDCGGTVRQENTVNFQLWTADDFDHRLKAYKLLDIIKLSEEKLNLPDVEIEVEYQCDTIGKYDLAFDGTHFLLKNKHTVCLAEDQCGIPAKPQKSKMKLSEFGQVCKPNSGCC